VIKFVGDLGQVIIMRLGLIWGSYKMKMNIFLYINELITRLSASAKSCSHSNIQAGCPAQTDYITLCHQINNNYTRKVWRYQRDN